VGVDGCSTFNKAFFVLNLLFFSLIYSTCVSKQVNLTTIVFTNMASTGFYFLHGTANKNTFKPVFCKGFLYGFNAMAKVIPVFFVLDFEARTQCRGSIPPTRPSFLVLTVV
jgi:hypothetical protein